MIVEPNVAVTRCEPDPTRRLVVTVVDGRRPGGFRPGMPSGATEATGALLCFPGFRTPMDDFEVQRLRLLAARTGRLVAGMECPGYGTQPARLDQQQRQALFRGDFGPLAAEMLEAAALATSSCLGSPVLVGFSMGAALAAAAARVLRTRGGAGLHPSAHVPTSVLLVEPVSIARWWLPALGIADYRDYLHLRRHLADNELLDWAVVPDAFRPRQQRRRVHTRAADLAAIVAGLSRGSIVADLHQAARTGPLPVDLVYGGRSHLVPRSRVEAVRTELNQAGCPGRLYPMVGRNHGLWHSLPDVARIADDLL